MKRITTLLILFLSFIVFSCSNDDNNGGPATGDLTLSGKVMSPNSAFPISKASVKVFRDSQLVQSVITDATGNFTINNLPEGNLTVELRKGKFVKTVNIDLTSDYDLLPSERNLDVFPSIAVVTGTYDQIESVLLNIGLVDPDTNEPTFDIVEGGFSGRYSESGNHHHQRPSMSRNSTSLMPNVDFTFSELLLDTTLLNSYDIIFLNCGASEEYAFDTTAMANLKAFIQNGGVLYATDWMYKYIESAFAQENYMMFALPEKAGDSDFADVTIADSDLTEWLEAQGLTVTPSVEINGFLPGWQLVDSYNASIVNDWLIADEVTYDFMPQTNKALAFTYKFQQGGVFYSSFHTHGNDLSEDVITQMMNYFVFELSALSDEAP